jgi:uncharacterized protein YbaR (Trm112 family)
MKKCFRGRRQHEWIHPLFECPDAGQSYYITEILACPWCHAVKPMPELRHNLKMLAASLRTDRKDRKP